MSLYSWQVLSRNLQWIQLIRLWGLVQWNFVLTIIYDSTADESNGIGGALHDIIYFNGGTPYASLSWQNMMGSDTKTPVGNRYIQSGPVPRLRLTGLVPKRHGTVGGC